jgi:hypothetical protein
MDRFLAIVLLTCCWCGAAEAARIWTSDRAQLYGVEAVTNEVLLSLPFRGIEGLAADAGENAVWVLTGDELRKVDGNGVTLLVLKLRDLGLGRNEDDDDEHQPVQLAFDGYRRTLWVAAGRDLAQLDHSGRRLSLTTVEQPVRSLAVSLDGSVWVLGNKRLFQVGADGTIKARYALTREEFAESKFVAVDALHERVWLLSKRGLLVSALSNPIVPVRIWSLPAAEDSIALDQETGNVWLIAGGSVAGYSFEAPQPIFISLASLGLKSVHALAFDSQHAALWLAHQRGITRLDRLGQFVAEVPIPSGPGIMDDDEDDEEDDEDSKRNVQPGVPALVFVPSLTLLRPPENALTNDPQPEIHLGFGAQCSGQPCMLAPSFFSSYVLSATLNSAAIGRDFRFNPDTAQSLYVPPQRLPEGANRFEAWVTDSFGHRSNTVDTPFTVDTAAPTFLAVEPAEGTVFTVNQVSVTATIDDPLGVVVVEGFGANTAATTTATSATFVYPLMLLPGINSFRLSAIDRAGNVATRTLALSYLPVRVDIEQPADEASVQGQQIIVSGTWQGPENTGITVNGVVASLFEGRFYASVALATGSNRLQAVASTPDGFSATDSVAVSRGAAPAFTVNATSSSGVAPLEVEFAVSTSAEHAAGRLDADFDGDGTVDFSVGSAQGATAIHKYVQPGTYFARFTVTSPEGSSTVETVLIAVDDRLEIDRLLRAQWSTFTSALAARNKTEALRHIAHRQRDRYAAIFDALLPDLPEIVASFSPLQWTSSAAPDPANPERELPQPFVSPEIGEYAVNRTVDGVNQVFFIYFMRDVDGVWRLDSM